MKRRSRVGGKPPKARHREALKPKHSDASKTASSSGVIQDSEIARLTRELHEAREQQTAASEVLEVISRSPGDLEPVFAAMLENAIHICGARFGGIYGIDGGVLRLLATHNLPEAYETARSTRPFRPGPKHFFRRMMETKTAFQVADAATEQKYLERSPEFVAAVELAGIRTFLVVPMLKENELVGGFLVARQEVRPFTDKQIELVKNFAAQAVIAIENTRLLNELRQRTDDLTGRTADLTEALEQQSATSEVLRVISSSPGDLQPVFEAMLENAVRICDAMGGGICRWDGDALHHVALKWAHPAFAEFLMRTPIHPNPKTSFGHMLATKTVVHVPDLAAQPAYAEQREPGIVTAVEVGHIRTALYVPMLKGSELIGAFTVGSEEVRPFTEKQIDLVSNFAAQAVIAIENARLLSELRESLQQQTGTAGVLRIISSSPGELKPVFDAILENATRICEAAFGTLGLLEGDAFRRVALYNAPPDYVAAHERNPIIERQTAASTLYRLRETKDFVHVADMAAESPDAEITQRGGARTLLVVPMLQENELVGAVGIYRQEVRPFNDKQIDLVKNFAAQAVIAIENARLLNELRESLQQQTATADVLKVISRTTFDLQIVFNTLVESAVRLSDSYDAVILLREGDSLVVRAHNGPIPQDFRKWQLARTWVAGRATVDGRAVHVHDLIAEGEEFPEGHAMALRMGHRTILSVPLLRGDEAIGCLTVRRTDVRPFTEKQITLVTTFADQAVIAIENARLLNELRQRTTDLSEALDQQTATSEVLQTISSSPGDLEPVFAAMLEKAVRICDASFGNIYRWDGGMFSLAASFNTPTAFTEYRKRSPIGVGPATASDHMAKPISTLDSFILQRKVVHIADLTKDQRYIEREPDTVASVELGGVRTVLAAPMLKDNEWIGVLVLSRQEVRSFTDKQIALVTNFASQAVIAIENARLLNELRQSLEQQTATSEVLRVISSSPGDLQPVFTSILANATRICEANFGVLVLYENSVFHVAATHNAPPAFVELRRHQPTIRASGALGRVVAGKRLVHISDCLDDASYKRGDADFVRFVDLCRVRSLILAPMLKDHDLMGVIGIYRTEVRPFSDKQIELVQNFAAQAVIAIENTRLLTELRHRTDDLTEALEQQTATSEVLQVISTSSGDLEPVFASMLENAVRISGAKFGIIHGWDGENSRLIATHNLPVAFDEARRRALQWRPGPKTAIRRMAATKKVVHIPNLVEDETYVEDHSPQVVAAVELGRVRTMLAVPMLKDDEVIGAFTVYRQEVRPFTDKQIDLVKNFASQAVIAIENARLLTELRQRTDELAQRQAELSVTFDNMGDGVVMFNEENRLAAWNRNLQQILDLPDSFFAEPRTYREYMTYLIERGEFGDVDLETELRRYIESADRQRRVERTRPDGRVLEVRVNPVPGGGFVAIYSDVTERKKAEERVRVARDAAESALGELKAAQDRLVQTEKLASLGQLTAGIAHEIKNPLNFVNNFSSMSVELIDELRATLGSIHLDDNRRTEINEIADMLQGNLDKVVQHGKRADSIVKNMLLHSRAGSGEHRPVDVNALVEESLNLAYHGARAEKQGFNITLERSFDPAAGEVDLFPQEITRVLLNLISNGFYAATKRKAEAEAEAANEDNYEPTLAAATKNLGDSVEIRIRDNGTGIPAEVKEKMFNPFFTTKPAGEGTGLGLSISHDIIVKQHGGSIEVDTQPGEFTEFRIVLPRRAVTVA